MATDVACRTADTGFLFGSRQPPIAGYGHKLEKTDFVVNLASNVGIGVLEDWLLTRRRAQTTATVKSNTTVSGIVGRIPKPFRATPVASGNCLDSLKVYKAGPLSGIWATGPYLHNGAVPSLWDLLLPSAKRPTKFNVGSRKFDSINVGFDSHDGSFQLDTALPGNSNAGHSYGALLTDDERWQLIEYLKTL